MLLGQAVSAHIRALCQALFTVHAVSRTALKCGSGIVALQSVDNRPAVRGRLAVPAFPLAPTRVGQALPVHRAGPATCGGRGGRRGDPCAPTSSAATETEALIRRYHVGSQRRCRGEAPPRPYRLHPPGEAGCGVGAHGHAPLPVSPVLIEGLGWGITACLASLIVVFEKGQP